MGFRDIRDVIGTIDKTKAVIKKGVVAKKKIEAINEDKQTLMGIGMALGLGDNCPNCFVAFDGAAKCKSCDWPENGVSLFANDVEEDAEYEEMEYEEEE